MGDWGGERGGGPGGGVWVCYGRGEGGLLLMRGARCGMGPVRRVLKRWWGVGAICIVEGGVGC